MPERTTETMPAPTADESANIEVPAPRHAYLHPHDLARVDRGLAQLLPAGVGPEAAIEVLCTKLAEPAQARLTRALREVQEHLRRGADLPDAVESVHEFPPSFTERVRVHVDIQRAAG